jgi:3-carboxy-cis,cis-muconate cycloisomerase
VAEAVMMRLGEHIGRQQAHDVVYEACEQAVAENSTLYQVLAQNPIVAQTLSDQALQQLLDPINYIGLAPFFTDQITHRANDK